MSGDELPLYIHALHNICTLSSVFFDGLLFLCVYEILSSISMFIMFSRVIPLGFDGIVVVFEGPCKHFPVRFCYGVYSVLLNGLISCPFLAILSFFVLRFPVPSMRQTTLFNTVLAIPAIIWTITFNFGMAPREMLNPLLEKHVPEYNLTNTPLGGILHPLQSPVLPSIIWIILSSSPCFFLNIWAGFSIRKLLDRESTNLTARISRVHQEFLSALVWQLLISQWFNVGVVTYLLEQFNIARAPALEYAVHMSGGVAIAASPLVTLYFVKPYRRRFLKILLRTSEATDTCTVRELRSNRPQSREFGAISPDRQSVVTAKAIKMKH
ncbi:hypothetical protein PRIPAC_79839 [Pristionchus pacificus]|uniref:G protein-coupled receptor n=1 Tax=Pristionchus pacificus TaxID=54126 RepID=A0A2A6C4M4_PRIPA|nr:hypothetical protein PRIPAC_79839 [Pristionchus pacificus]|eukprot:PDM73003.1 G protein-coupled receptor [Pristionchus pacificus]